MFFQTKKVKLETLPEYLRVVRQQLNLSLAEASKNTGVAVKTLEVLEEGAYHRLPSKVYARGFLAQIAHAYSIDKDLLIRQFEFEQQIHKAVSRPLSLKPARKKRFFEDWVITPKNLSLTGGAAFAVLTVIYIIWQVLAIGQVPLLEIENPENLTVIEKSFVEIAGRTDPGATITINNEAVFVEADGRFKTNIGLSGGPKEINVVAKNRFNKIARKTLTIIGYGRSTADDLLEVKLELEFTDAVEISYKIDGGSEISESFKAGDKKLIEAKKLIVFSTADAGRVKAKINGQLLGFLGREGERLTNISFSPESGNMSR